jgi:hypothetical protein
VTDPYGRILAFLDRNRYFSIKQLLSCTHEAEWTPFQTHYFFLTPIQYIQGALYLGIKLQGRVAAHSPPTNAKVKKTWIYTSTSPYAFMT